MSGGPKKLQPCFEGCQSAGVIVVGKGKPRLIHPGQLVPDRELATDRRITDWEGGQHLIRSLIAERGGGVTDALGMSGSWTGSDAGQARVGTPTIAALAISIARRSGIPYSRI